MTEKNQTATKIWLVRFIITQLMAVSLLVIFFSQDFFALPLLVDICWLILFLATLVLNYTFIHERKYDRDKLNFKNDILIGQIVFILVSLLLTIYAIWNGFTATDFYRKIISFLLAFLLLILTILLVWGLKYARQYQKKR